MEAYVDVASFESAMEGIAKETGVEMNAIMRDNSALVCADLIKYTPPIDVGAGYKGSDASAYRLAKASVDRDIRGIVYGARNWNRVHLAEASGAMIHYFIGEKIMVPAKRKGKMKASRLIYGVESEYVSEDGAKLAAYHKQRRLPSNGHVGSGAKTAANERYKLGDRVMSRKMHVPEPVLKNYIREVQSHIGKTRAGWMPAFEHFSANALTSRYNPPAWVQNQPRMGSFTDSGNMEQISGDWTATNSVPWIRRTAIARLVTVVMDIRTKDFWKGNYRMRLERVLKKREAATV